MALYKSNFLLPFSPVGCGVNLVGPGASNILHRRVQPLSPQGLSWGSRGFCYRLLNDVEMLKLASRNELYPHASFILYSKNVATNRPSA